MKKLFNFIFPLFLLVLLSSSCTFTKIVIFFKPSINDHKNVFACDTIHGNPQEWATSSLSDLHPNEPLFVNAHCPDNVPDIQKWMPIEEQLKTSNFDDFLKKSKTTSFIIIKNDTILYERYLGVKKEDPKVVFSVTKGITATLAAIACSEGLMSFDQKVSDFIPEFANDARKDITIRHLAGMVSGLDWNDFNNLLRLGALYYNPNQQRFVKKASKAKYTPDSHFAYASLSTQILGICLEKATGISMAEYLEEKIWKPVGMEHNALMTIDSKKNHNSRTFGGMALTPSDMARFGKLMLNNGVWNGKQIVPQWFVNEVKYRKLDKFFGYSHSFWRNGYETEDLAGNQHFCAAGYGGQYIYVAPKENIILIRTGSNEKNRWLTMLGRLAHLMNKGENDLTNNNLDYGAQFEGSYKNQEGKTMQLALLPERDQYSRRQWTWTRDVQEFKEGKQHKKLTQLDGISLGYKKNGDQTRLYYDVKNGKVVGFYYNSWPSMKLEYFSKVE